MALPDSWCLCHCTYRCQPAVAILPNFLSNHRRPHSEPHSYLMARVISTSQTIRKSPAEVWEVLTDWPKATAWMPSVMSMQAEGPTQVGTKINYKTRRDTFHSTITELDEGRKLTLRTEHGNVTADYTYDLVDVAEGTKVSLNATCELSGHQWFGPILRLMMRLTDGSQIKKLKSMVEAS